MRSRASTTFSRSPARDAARPPRRRPTSTPRRCGRRRRRSGPTGGRGAGAGAQVGGASTDTVVSQVRSPRRPTTTCGIDQHGVAGLVGEREGAEADRPGAGLADAVVDVGAGDGLRPPLHRVAEAGRSRRSPGGRRRPSRRGPRRGAASSPAAARGAGRGAAGPPGPRGRCARRGVRRVRLGGGRGGRHEGGAYAGARRRPDGRSAKRRTGRVLRHLRCVDTRRTKEAASACSRIAALAARAPRPRRVPSRSPWSSSASGRPSVGVPDLERALPPRHRRRRGHDRGRGQPGPGRRHPRPHRHPPARARARHPRRRCGPAAAARPLDPAEVGPAPRRDRGAPGRSSTTRAGCRCCAAPRSPRPSSSSATTARGSGCAGWASSAASASPTCCRGSTRCAPTPRRAPCSACPARRRWPGSSVPSARARCPTSTADDVVLLTGEATDRFTTVVRDAHLAPAARWPGWRRPASSRRRWRTSRRPTSCWTTPPPGCSRTCSRPATVDGVAWHETPREVLEATSAAGGRGQARARGRGSSPPRSTRSAPWWGGRMRVLVLDTARQPARSAAWRPALGVPDRAHRAPPGGQARPGPRARRGRRCPAAPTHRGLDASPAAPRAGGRRPGLRLLARRVRRAEPAQGQER